MTLGTSLWILYFLQTRLRGREGKEREGTLPTAPSLCRLHRGWERTKGKEEAWSISSWTLTHRSNIPAPSLLFYLSWLQLNEPQSPLFSFQLLNDKHNSDASSWCLIKNNILWQIITIREMTRLLLMQLHRGQPCSQVLNSDKDLVTCWTVMSTSWTGLNSAGYYHIIGEIYPKLWSGCSGTVFIIYKRQ